MVDISTLNPVAYAAAERAEKGGLTITSAKRNPEDQARAMASDVVLNHQYIVETYVESPIRDALQAWVDQNRLLASDQSSCEQGLLGVLNTFAPEDLRHLSWHISGDAFDCEPDGNDAHLKLLQQIVADSIASGGEAKLLTMEAGLVRWHVQLAGGDPPVGSSSAGESSGSSGSSSTSSSGGPGGSSWQDTSGGSSATGSPSPEPAGHAGHAGHPFPGTLLEVGSQSEEVRMWQERLQVLGHDVQADGIFGQHTEEATKEFQTSKGLSVDGIVGHDTWGAAFE